MANPDTQNPKGVAKWAQHFRSELKRQGMQISQVAEICKVDLEVAKGWQSGSAPIPPDKYELLVSHGFSPIMLLFPTGSPGCPNKYVQVKDSRGNPAGKKLVHRDFVGNTPLEKLFLYRNSSSDSVSGFPESMPGLFECLPDDESVLTRESTFEPRESECDLPDSLPDNENAPRTVGKVFLFQGRRGGFPFACHVRSSGQSRLLLAVGDVEFDIARDELYRLCQPLGVLRERQANIHMDGSEDAIFYAKLLHNALNPGDSAGDASQSESSTPSTTTNSLRAWILPLLVSWILIGTLVNTPSFSQDRRTVSDLAECLPYFSDKVCIDPNREPEVRENAGQGQAEAQFLLGFMYARGHGVSQDNREAAKWYGLAADQGHKQAQAILGEMYTEGSGVYQDLQKAVKWYLLAASQGEVNAQAALGSVYIFGRGVNQDFAKAVTWLRLAADQGHDGAQHNLGTLYRNGDGVTRDAGEAVKWLSRSAVQGLSESQYDLGNMYYAGEGVTRDYARAVKWYRLAAAQGHHRAQNNLGTMYLHGDGVSQDYGEALRWLHMSADQENCNAQFNLGQMHESGVGVPQSDMGAVKWYKLAAAQGNEDAANKLGMMYMQEIGVRRDDTEALKWFSVSPTDC